MGASPVSVVWDVGGVTPEVFWGRGLNRDTRCSTLPEEKVVGQVYSASWFMTRPVSMRGVHGDMVWAHGRVGKV